MQFYYPFQACVCVGGGGGLTLESRGLIPENFRKEGLKKEGI